MKQKRLFIFLLLLFFEGHLAFVKAMLPGEVGKKENTADRFSRGADLLKEARLRELASEGGAITARGDGLSSGIKEEGNDEGEKLSSSDQEVEDYLIRANEVQEACLAILQAEEKAEKADQDGNDKASLFYWGEAFKKTIAACKELDLVEKIYASEMSQRFEKGKEEPFVSFSKTANDSKKNWNIMRAYYKAKERTAAARLAQKSIESSPENRGLKNSLIQSTQQAAVAWERLVIEKLASEASNYKISFEKCKEMEAYWKRAAEDIQKQYKDFLEAKKGSPEELTKGATGTRGSPSEKMMTFGEPLPLEALSDEEKMRDSKALFLEGRDIPMQSSQEKKRVRTLKTSSVYPYVRTEEIINSQGQVLSRNRMVADELVVEPGEKFDLTAFREAMKPEVISMRKETIFEKASYILSLSGHSIDALESVQEKIKMQFDSDRVKQTRPVFFLSSLSDKEGGQDLIGAVGKVSSLNDSESEAELESIMKNDHGGGVNESPKESDPIVAISDTGLAKDHPFFNDPERSLRISGAYFAVGPAIRMTENRLKGCMTYLIRELVPNNEVLVPQNEDHAFEKNRKIERVNFISEFAAEHLVNQLKEPIISRIENIIARLNEELKTDFISSGEVGNKLTAARNDLIGEENPSFQDALLGFFGSTVQERTDWLALKKAVLKTNFETIYQEELSENSANNFLPPNLLQVLTGVIAGLVDHRDPQHIVEQLVQAYPDFNQEDLLDDEDLKSYLEHDVIGHYLTKDKAGHGTSCAGVLARFTQNGIPLFVCKRAHDEQGTVIDTAKSIEEAYKRGAAILNCSFDIFGENNSPDEKIVEVLEKVGQSGENGENPMAVVIAAGNKGNALADKKMSALKHLLFVGATNEANDDLLDRRLVEALSVNQVASNHGKDLVRIAARGENVLTTSADRYSKAGDFPLYHRKHGTSLSTSRVAAVLNYLKKQFVELDGKNLIDTFLDNESHFIGTIEALREKIENGRVLRFGRINQKTA